MTTSRHTPDNCKIHRHLGTCEICEREPETTSVVCSECGVVEVRVSARTVGWFAASICTACFMSIFDTGQTNAERAHAAGIAAVAQALEVQG